jgi:predicted MPP superfamily phosphohydrolase
MKKTLRIIRLFFIAILCFLRLTGDLSAQNLYSSSSGDSLRPLVVYGDSRSNHVIHQKIINGIIKYKPAAVFHTGDLVYNGKSEENWSIFNSIVADLIKIAPLYPAVGNHELGTLKIQQELKLPNEGMWYSVDVQKIHFILLDVCSPYSSGSPQYQWLQKDLAQQPADTRFTVVLTHYPFYSSSFHQTQTKRLRRELIPLFTKYGVDLVFSGHNHCYERCYSGGIYFLTTAGGGAPLYDLKKKDPTSQLFVKTYHFCTLTQSHDSLFVTAIDTNFKTIDRFGIPALRTP